MPSLFRQRQWSGRKIQQSPDKRQSSCLSQLKSECQQWWSRNAAAGFLLIALVIALYGIASLAWLGIECGWPMRSILIPAAGLILFGAFLNEVSEIKSRANIQQELTQFNWRRLVIRTLAWGSLAYAAHYILNPCD